MYESLKCLHNIKLHMPFKKDFPKHPSGSFKRLVACLESALLWSVCLLACVFACYINHKSGHESVCEVKLCNDKEIRKFPYCCFLYCYFAH